MAKTPDPPTRFFGQIVLAHIDDGHGNRKQRPAVIVSPNDEINSRYPYRVVCVSTQIDDPLPPVHVKLPWSRPRHPRTGLDKANVAKCDWLAQIVEYDIIRTMGHVPPKEMGQITGILKNLEK